MIAKLANKPHNHGDVNFFSRIHFAQTLQRHPSLPCYYFMSMVVPPCDGAHPEFSREPRNTQKTYFAPPLNLPKRLIWGGGAGRGATVRRTLRDRKRTQTGKLSDFDAPDVPPGLSSPENFRVSRRFRRLPHRTRASLMYSTAAPGVDFVFFF